MFRPQKTVAAAAAALKRALKKLARPAGTFDASRYFRGDHALGFYNTGTTSMRALARDIYLAHRDQWTARDAVMFAHLLMPDRYLETKAVGLEVLARFRREFTPPLLGRCQRWLARNYSANWATTDEMCGVVIGPLLIKHPELMPRMRLWAKHRNMWVRRASIVGLLPAIRRGDTDSAVDLVYEIAGQLHPDPNDLIHKAVGWALREAGKIDSVRLERYLRRKVAVIPRTTFRYAIERFDARKRAQLLSIRR
jgi:3-methyladenine DNA glycosylase AlkD